MTIQELLPIVGTRASFARANGYSRNDMDDGVVDDARAIVLADAMEQGRVPRFALRVSSEVCAWAAELDRLDRVDECNNTRAARVDFCSRTHNVFEALLEPSDIEFELSAFSYSREDECAEGRVTYTIELDAEELLRIHNGYAHYKAVEIRSVDYLVGTPFGCYISDQPSTRLVIAS